MFLRPEHRGASRVQAAFRAAYLLPPASSVAVGSDDAEHLRELVDALMVTVSGVATTPWFGWTPQETGYDLCQVVPSAAPRTSTVVVGAVDPVLQGLLTLPATLPGL
ncbi:hypothetical protein HEP86_36000 [Streptomyces sp. RPA4-5]|uniref:hypothetical protein n=1 Tax=Streptomyces TaxID=1883 RepID=UPI00143ECF9F|nr:hypothetical protein [Streptomyces platensis]QIY58893.1 hypothetical protein HEP86_36000 [Streptomyces sp. RPA4-5]